MQLYEESLVSNSLQHSTHAKTFVENKCSKNFRDIYLLFRNARQTSIPSSPLSVMIAMSDLAPHERRLETSYTVQLGL